MRRRFNGFVTLLLHELLILDVKNITYPNDATSMTWIWGEHLS